MEALVVLVIHLIEEESLPLQDKEMKYSQTNFRWVWLLFHNRVMYRNGKPECETLLRPSLPTQCSDETVSY